MGNEDLKFRAVLDDAFTHTATKIQGSIGGLAKGAGVAMAGMVTFQKAVEFATASIEEFKNSEIVVARLSATIKAVGDRTSLTADTVQKFATQMQSRTIFGDEAIMNAERIMLTMQNISDEVIPLAIEASANMADSEEELASKAFALGKALESPADGFSALKKSGVILGEQTEEMLKQLTEEGRLREAQGILLAEIEKRYGGVSDAMAKTAEGMATINRNAIGDQMEEIGKRLVPVADLFGKIALKATEAAAWMLQVFNAERWAALTDAQKKYSMQFSEMTKEQLFTMRSALKEEEKAMLLSGTYRVGDLRDRQDKIAALKDLLKEKVDAEKASLATTASNMASADATEAAGVAASNARKAQESAEKVKKADEERLKLKERADKTFEAVKKAIWNEQLEKDKVADAEFERAMAQYEAEGNFANKQLEEKKRIALEEARVKESIEQAKRNAIVSTGKTMAEGLVSAIKLATESNKKTKEDALKIAVLQGAIAHAGAAASIWSTVGGSWQEKLVESIAISAALFTAQAVQIASINKQNFATGGIVQGASSGDNVSVKANGGEMFLTKSMQQNLLTMAHGQGGGGGASIVISPTVKVDSGMTAGERDRMVRATAESVRNAMIHLVQTNRVPAGLVYR